MLNPFIETWPSHHGHPIFIHLLVAHPISQKRDHLPDSIVVRAKVRHAHHIEVVVEVQTQWVWRGHRVAQKHLLVEIWVQGGIGPTRLLLGVNLFDLFGWPIIFTLFDFLPWFAHQVIFFFGLLVARNNDKIRCFGCWTGGVDGILLLEAFDLLEDVVSEGVPLNVGLVPDAVDVLR